MRKGMTLTEIIVVLAIVLVLTGLILPVFTRARQESKLAPCLTNLRQIATGAEIYANDANGELPLSIESALPKARSSFVCPLDTSPGLNEQDTFRLNSKVSYYYLPHEVDFRKALLAADSNHGLAYDVLHADHQDHYLGRIEESRNETGLVVIVRRDGSVTRRIVPRWCSSTGAISARPSWVMLSSEPPPEAFVRPLVGPCPR